MDTNKNNYLEKSMDSKNVKKAGNGSKPAVENNPVNETGLKNVTKSDPGKKMDVSKDDEIYGEVTQEPSFPGGEAAWDKFLANNLKQNIAAENGLNKEGKYAVGLQFVVLKDGSISNPHCYTDPGYGMCEEAIRVMKYSPRWNPGINGSQAVNSYRRIEIIFYVSLKKSF
jgi:protein TonB